MTDPTGFAGEGVNYAGGESPCAKGSYCAVSTPNGLDGAQYQGQGRFAIEARNAAQGIGDRSCTIVASSSGASGEIKPTEETFFRDSIAGRFLSDTIGKGIALFTDHNVNPLSGDIENFRGDNRAIEIIELGSNFIPFGGQEKRAATVAESIFEHVNPCKCFVAGTPVQTKHGLKPIEKIQVGDLVTARDGVTGETAWKSVLRVIRNGEKDVLRVEYVDENGKHEFLGVTHEHPFMLEGKRWVEAGKLVPGDKMMRLDGGLLIVEKIGKYKVRHHTYNLEVADFHTYFVGAMGVWVHNIDCPKVAASVAMGAKEALQAINLPARIRASGMSLPEAGKFFGWGAQKITKPLSDFSKESLESMGWTRENVSNVAEGYREINKVTPNNPSALMRAEQLESLLLLWK